MRETDIKTKNRQQKTIQKSKKKGKRANRNKNNIGLAYEEFWVVRRLKRKSEEKGKGGGEVMTIQHFCHIETKKTFCFILSCLVCLFLSCVLSCVIPCTVLPCVASSCLTPVVQFWLHLRLSLLSLLPAPQCVVWP